MQNNFNFWIDIDLDKSVTTSLEDDSRYDNMIFEGVASDGSTDMDGESIDPSGIDLSYFLKRGLFNLDHLTSRSEKNKSRFWIGEPLEARIEDGKLIVRGKLWKKSPEARALWDKILAMKESGSSRRLGMSIEGKALEKDKLNPKKILKALITNIALTFNPVNFNTYAEICKGVQKEDWIEYEYEEPEDIILEIDSPKGKIKIDSNFRIKICR